MCQQGVPTSHVQVVVRDRRQADTRVRPRRHAFLDQLRMFVYSRSTETVHRRKGGAERSSRRPLRAGSDAVLRFQRLAGNGAVCQMLQGKENALTVQRFVYLFTKADPRPVENRIDPVGEIYVFGNWVLFDWDRWEREPLYQSWIKAGWNEPADHPDARPDPSTQPQHAPNEREGMNLSALMRAGNATVEQVTDETGSDVLQEIQEWQAYVQRGLDERPTSGETVFQLESSKTVLGAIATNLRDFVEYGDEDHDFDIARTAHRIESIMDSIYEEETNSFTVENIATNPRNLYSLRGEQPQQLRGTSPPLIENLVRLASKEGSEYVRIIALTEEHAKRYKAQGFELESDVMQTDEDSPEDAGTGTAEIPMRASVKSLSERFGLTLSV